MIRVQFILAVLILAICGISIIRAQDSKPDATQKASTEAAPDTAPSATAQDPKQDPTSSPQTGVPASTGVTDKSVPAEGNAVKAPPPLMLIIEAGAAESALIRAVTTDLQKSGIITADAVTILPKPMNGGFGFNGGLGSSPATIMPITFEGLAPTQPLVTLQINPKMPQNELVKTLSSIAKSGRIGLLQLALQTDLTTDKITGSIIAGQETPYTTIVDQIALLKTCGVASISLATGSNNTTLSPKPPQHVVLLILEADWSKSPTAKEVEADLKAALKDVSIPNGLRDSLLDSGPQILFAEENIAIYQPNQCASLLAWLEKHKLLKKAVPFGPLTLTSTRINQSSNVLRVTADSKFRDDQGLLPTPSNSQPEQPFVKTRLAWEWVVRTDPSSKSLFGVQLHLERLKQFQGQAEFQQDATTVRSMHSFSIPSGQVAIVHAFARQAGDGGLSPIESAPFTSVRTQGFVPLLLIRGAEPEQLPTNAAPALRVPELVVPYSGTPITISGEGSLNNSGGRFEPLLGGRGGRSSRPSPSMMGSAGGNKPTSSGSGDGEANAVEIRVYPLKYIKADDFHSIQRQLLGSDTNVTIDERTNSVLARGTQRQLNEIENIVKVVDLPGENPLAAKGGPASSQNDSNRSTLPAGSSSSKIPGKKSEANNSFSNKSNGKPAAFDPDKSVPKDAAALRDQYQSKEQRAAEVARELRLFQSQQPENRNRIDGAKAGLRQAVADSFAARQSLQRAEVAEFERRIVDLRQSIELRDRVQEYIIDRRVDDLLNPDLGWDSNASKTALPKAIDSGKATESDASPVKSGPTTGVPTQSESKGQSTLFGHVSSATQNQSALPASPGGGLLIRNISEFNRLLEEARFAESIAVNNRTKAREKRKRLNPDVTEDELEVDVQKNYAPQVQLSQHRLKLLRDELATQLQLLELEVQVAQEAVKSCEIELARTQQLHAKGYTPQSAFEQQTAKLKTAELAREKAKLLLELYRKIEPRNEPLPSNEK